MHVVDPDDPKKKPRRFADINEQVADASKASVKGFQHSYAQVPGGGAEGFIMGRGMKKRQDELSKLKEAKRLKFAGKGEL